LFRIKQNLVKALRAGLELGLLMKRRALLVFSRNRELFHGGLLNFLPRAQSPQPHSPLPQQRRRSGVVA
jgi:hypothetical protein